MNTGPTAANIAIDGHAHLKYRPDIDGLRAIAVLLVVGFHAFPGWLPGGFIGVDVFFVISGYLISTILIKEFNDEKFSYRRFYARRIKRIFPALTLVLLACLVAGWAILLRDEHRQVGKHIAGGSAFLSNLLLWRESGYFDEAAETKPLLHLWSLGIEEQFYIFWPILLGFLWKGKRNFLLLVGCVAALSFALNLWTVYSNPVAAFYSPLSRVWELMIGGALAYIVVQRTYVPTRAAQWFAALGLLLIGAAVLTVTKNSLFPGWIALLPTLGSFLIILAGPRAVVNRVLLSNRLMVWVGLISFPLYLWHWPLLTFARIVEGGIPSSTVRLIAVGLSILAAYSTYRLLEQPLRQSRSHFTVAGLATANVVLVVTGLLVYLGHLAPGIPLTPLQTSILRPYDASADYRKDLCFLDAKKQFASDFAKVCLESPVGANSKLVVLWGDSHAAHLYPGLHELAGAIGFQLEQRTATSCPPLSGGVIETASHCAEINRGTLTLIEAKKPSLVVMASRWQRDQSGLDEKVGATLQQLRSAGAQEILLFGPPPEWTPTLRHFLVRKAGVRDELAERYSPPAVTFAETKALDKRLQLLSQKLGFRYVSLIKALCNAEGCVVRVGHELPADLITMDYDHFTRSASISVMGSPLAKDAVSASLAAK